jgi:hypothetical protein
VIPYVTVASATDVTAGWGATTVKPFDRFPASPPAAVGFLTVTVYAPVPSPVFGHQNRTVLLLTNTYGTAAEATLPATVVPVKPPTVIWAPKMKFDPEIVTDWLSVTP